MLPGPSPAFVQPDGKRQRGVESKGGENATDEQQATERRIGLYEQVEDPAVLDRALQASHESVLIAAERSLRTYAEDLKHMNDIAMATAAKKLRELRSSTLQDMTSFRDRVCGDVVDQTREELDLLRSEWYGDVRAEAEKAKQEVHEASITAQHDIHELLSAHRRFVAQAQDVLTTSPMVDAHEAAMSTALVEYQLKILEANTSNKGEVGLMKERLRQLEKVVALLSNSSNVESLEIAGSYSPTISPASETLAPLKKKTTNASGGGAAPPPKGQSMAHSPSQTPQRVPPQKKDGSAVAELGISVKEAADGVVVVDVVPNSIAAEHQLGSGHIISHVDRTSVSSPTTFETALNACSGESFKLTTFDPQQGRVRVITITST